MHNDLSLCIQGWYMYMISEKQVIQFLKSKDQDYVNNLVAKLFVKDVSIDTIGGAIVCPNCGSLHTKKNGKDSTGQQRYICHDCNKSFVKSYGTLFFYSHFTQNEWIKFIDYELCGITLKDLAHLMNTSITTCFYMRHKLYKATSEIIQKQKLSEEIELDAEYLSINLKGTKPENMPRFSKRRGTQAAYRGISHHKICVTCAIDSTDHIMMNVVGLGSESYEKYMSVIEHFNDVKKLISDGKSCIRQYANELKANHQYIKPSPTQKKYLTEDGSSLASVNELMSEVEAMITRTRGFSTRYLQEYLDFMILKKQMNYSKDRDNCAKELFDSIKDTEMVTNALIPDTPLPISLKEAYYEYHYGIFADDRISEQQNS